MQWNVNYSTVIENDSNAVAWTHSLTFSWNTKSIVSSGIVAEPVVLRFWTFTADRLSPRFAARLGTGITNSFSAEVLKSGNIFSNWNALKWAGLSEREVSWSVGCISAALLCDFLWLQKLTWQFKLLEVQHDVSTVVDNYHFHQIQSQDGPLPDVRTPQLLCSQPVWEADLFFQQLLQKVPTSAFLDEIWSIKRQSDIQENMVACNICNFLRTFWAINFTINQI